MQKIKNFGSLSKSLTKLTKKKSPATVSPPPIQRDDVATTYPKQQQQYENHRFYVPIEYQHVEPNTAAVTGPTKSKTKIRSSKSMAKKKDTASDPYENQEFHSPRPSIYVPTTLPASPTDASPQPPPIDISASSPVLNHYDSNTSSQQTASVGVVPVEQTLSRKKSKSGKSFKSKFRKSLGPDTSINLGSSFNGNRSTFYISDSVDVDSGIFTSSSAMVPYDDRQNVTASSTTLQSNGSDSMPIGNDNDGSVASTITTTPTTHGVVPDISRRKSSLSVRPNNPPPPPPVDKRMYKTKRLGTTSWYAECGVFKEGTLNESNGTESMGNVGPVGGRPNRKERKSTSSWYADAGLYQTSGASVASSSGSSGVSTGGECGPGDDSSHSMFLNEPLYQIYSAAKLEVCCYSFVVIKCTL